MSKAKHVYWAVRHGEWSCGWDRIKGEPWFSFDHGYYDGNWGYVHIGWLWIGVTY